MATPVPAAAGSLWQVIVRGSQSGIFTENVLNFRAATAVDDWELRVILALIQCYQILLPSQPGNFSQTDVLWKQTSPVLGVEHITTFAPPNVGTLDEDSLPSYCSVVVSIRTALGGRSHRGRMYLPAIAESQTGFNMIQAASPAWTNLLSFAACLATKFITIGDPPAANSAQLGVYSRKLGGSTFPYGAQGFTAAATITPEQLLGTTRSRKQGHGP
jgi:hypothetical protein